MKFSMREEAPACPISIEVSLLAQFLLLDQVRRSFGQHLGMQVRAILA
jgi:hypothetical protein